MELELRAENFRLKLQPTVFREDISHPIDTTMTVTVVSDGFAGTAAMDIKVSALAAFSQKLCRIYDTLSGEARIEEPYGTHMYLSFQGDGRGHVAVKGSLFAGNRAGNEHSLAFENSVDQSELKPFCFALRECCAEYEK